MSKQIKAIKCPQCGSTQNTEIRTDYFRCDSCGTEYYLDNDDININHTYTYNYNQPAATPEKNVKRVVLVILAVAFIFIVGGMIAAFLSSTTSSSTYSSGKLQPVEVMKYSVFHSEKALFVDSKSQPCIVVMEQRNYYTGTDANGFYLVFFDAQTNKEISNKLLEGVNKTLVSSTIDSRGFSNGDIYFTLNKNKIYKLDKTNLSISDVSASLFKSQPELQSGVATIEFVYENYGDGLTLMTNDGKNYTYYPRVDKLYNKDELYKAENKFETLLPGAVERSYYTFTNKGFDYPDEKLQLLRITYKDNVGGPQNMLSSPSWQKDYGGSGFFTGSDPYKKILIGKTSMQYSRIISYKDITPDRLYFEPDVITFDNSNVLITSKASAAPDAQLNLQSLDASTGAVKWTLALTDINPKNAVSFNNGYVLMDYNDVAVVNKNGSLIKQYKLN